MKCISMNIQSEEIEWDYFTGTQFQFNFNTGSQLKLCKHVIMCTLLSN